MGCDVLLMAKCRFIVSANTLNKYKYVVIGTPESEGYLWSMNDVCLELTHNHGTESDENYKVDIYGN
jgi:hypothetical protein